LLYLVYSISSLLFIAFPGGFRGYSLEDEHGRPVPTYDPLWPEAQALDFEVYLSPMAPPAAHMGGHRPKIPGGSRSARLVWLEENIHVDWDKPEGVSRTLNVTEAIVGPKIWRALLRGERDLFAHCYLTKRGAPRRESSESRKRKKKKTAAKGKNTDEAAGSLALIEPRGASLDFFDAVYAGAPLVQRIRIAREVRKPKRRLVFPTLGNCGCGGRAAEAALREPEELARIERERREIEAERGEGPSPHWRPLAAMNLMVDRTRYPQHEVPPLIGQFLLVDRRDRRASAARAGYLPPLFADGMALTTDRFLPLNGTVTWLPLNVTLTPSSLGKWQFAVVLEQSLAMMESAMGAGDRDSDDVRRLVSDTHPLLLLLVMTVSLLHLLFDALAFQSDIQFWKSLKTMKGLSARAVTSSLICQIVVLAFLHHGEASMLVLVPAAFGVAVQAWKVRRVATSRAARLAHRPDEGEAERLTAEIDARASAYLGLTLYPLCVGWALFSLLCEAHEGWWSWTIHSAVSMVYTFGFIMMTPQLFINYRLKSVAHLPWRFLCYRALNTFIDDLFAFIITMPTMHRLSCFRDDLVFFIYLYQRWIYPEDMTRASLGVETSAEEPKAKKPEKSKAGVEKEAAKKIEGRNSKADRPEAAGKLNNSKDENRREVAGLDAQRRRNARGAGETKASK
jgi:hypothetical protein